MLVRSRRSRAPGAAAANLVWQFADAATLYPAASTSMPLATGVPAGALFSPSPDLLPGQTLSQSGDTLSLVSDSTLPTTTSDRDIVIEVMDSPLATIFNRTKSTSYGKLLGTTWFDCICAADHGDLIEISPGAINATLADSVNYYSSNLQSAAMVVLKGVTIRGIPGRGRWRLYPPGVVPGSGASGIVVFEATTNVLFTGGPDQAFGQRNVSISGFDVVDQLGSSRTAGDGTDPRDACGLKIRAPSAYNVSDWSGFHLSLTVGDFKIGRTAYQGGHGLAGGVRTLTVTDGHVFDMGSAGFDHNAYVSAETETVRGVRSSRSRGWTPGGTDNSAATLDGHLWKTDCQTGTFEGCSFDSDPALGDNSVGLQLYGGGNVIVRGCLFVDPLNNQSSSRGPISYCREHQEDSSPNFGFFAGLSGNVLLVEKNVFCQHFPRPAVHFFPSGHIDAIQAYSAGDPTNVARLTSASTPTVRDNIAMIPSTVTNWNSAFILPGFPGSGNSMYVVNDPNAGPNWATRGNTAITFDDTEAPFINRAIKEYELLAGAAAAAGGSVATYRFQWPHGSIARTDALKGLG